MRGMILDEETKRQLQRCDDSYRQVSLQLDLARLEYYQLRTVSSTDPQLGHLLEKIVQLVRERDALSSELNKLEKLS
jgi:chromosome segregation ATPase